MTRAELMQTVLLALTRQNVVWTGGDRPGDIVRSGLVIWYDGINNTGNGHSSNTDEWCDLSGNGNHGVILNGTWDDDELIFNGTSTWVNCGQKNFQAVTMECLLAVDGKLGEWTVIAGNFQNGGYGLNGSPSGFRMQVYKGGGYKHLGIGPERIGTYTLLAGSADTAKRRGYVDGQLTAEEDDDQPISPTTGGTVFALGANVSGSSAIESYFQGRIRSFRMYDRVLTAEEIKQNYDYDKRRFGW